MVKRRNNSTWQAALLRVRQEVLTAPDALRTKVIQLCDDICDFGDQEQVPPHQMAALLAGVLGLLSMAAVGGNVHDDEGIDSFIEHCHAAVHIAVAQARLANGWTPHRV